MLNCYTLFTYFTLLSTLTRLAKDNNKRPIRPTPCAVSVSRVSRRGQTLQSILIADKRLRGVVVESSAVSMCTSHHQQLLVLFTPLFVLFAKHSRSAIDTFYKWSHLFHVLLPRKIQHDNLFIFLHNNII